MKVLYHISTHTNENSNYKLHIPEKLGGNIPLCQQHNDKALSSYEYIEGEPTCKKCLASFRVLTGRTWADYVATERLLDKIAAMPLVTEIKL